MATTRMQIPSTDPAHHARLLKARLEYRAEQAQRLERLKQRVAARAPQPPAPPGSEPRASDPSGKLGTGLDILA
ncbi:MAG: hypothetical protein NZ561_11550 [Phycisphaerae bacterium]|nr:hypothetical protein [Phycisphaerae bacterium]MDW8262257.1 hypothetical protein [Phycisphaerales bacterium]